MPEMSPPFGPVAQGEIYVGSADDLALDPDEWESRAKAVLEPGPFDYIAGGAGGESTMHANRDAFARWRLRPTMLAGNQRRDLHVNVLRTPPPAPFFLAPRCGPRRKRTHGARARPWPRCSPIWAYAGTPSPGYVTSPACRCLPRVSCAPTTRGESSTPAFKASLFPTMAAGRWMGPSLRSMRWW